MIEKYRKKREKKKREREKETERQRQRHRDRTRDGETERRRDRERTVPDRQADEQTADGEYQLAQPPVWDDRTVHW